MAASSPNIDSQRGYIIQNLQEAMNEVNEIGSKIGGSVPPEKIKLLDDVFRLALARVKECSDTASLDKFKITLKPFLTSITKVWDAVHNKGSASEKSVKETFDRGEALKKILEQGNTSNLVATVPKVDVKPKTFEFKSAGSIAGGVGVDQSAKENLKLFEKVCLAKDLLNDLKTAHESGIAHEDIHDGYLVLEKNQGPHGYHRLHLAKADKNFPYGNNEMYTKKDLYAAGCTLYGLLKNMPYYGPFYDKLNNFGNQYDTRGSRPGDDLLVGELNDEIKRRRIDLERTYNAGTINPQEKFEFIILQMMHPRNDDSRDAAYFERELESLVNRKDLFPRDVQ